MNARSAMGCALVLICFAAVSGSTSASSAPLAPVSSRGHVGVPPLIRPDSFQVLATYHLRSGAWARVFTGIRKGMRGASQRPVDKSKSCFGVQTKIGAGLSCGVGVGPAQAMLMHITAFEGIGTLTSGVAVQAVANVLVTKQSFRTLTIPLKNGAFLYEGRALSVAPLNAAGDVLTPSS